MEADPAQDWAMQAKSTDWFEILSTCREEDSATRGFKLLHKEWKKEESRLGLATRLWATEEEPWRLLIQLWATNFVHYDADSAAGLLVTTADLLAFCGVTPGFGDRGEQLALHILKEQLEYIYNHLSSGSNPKILGALAVLEQIALTGQGVLEEMIRVFDFNLACLPGIVRPRADRVRVKSELKERWHKSLKLAHTPRVAYLRWCLAMLRHASPYLLEQLLAMLIIGGSLLPGLQSDQSEWQLKILKFMTRRVLVPEIPAVVQGGTLHEGSLQSLAEMVVWAETSEDEAEVESGKLAARILLAALSDPAHGVAAPPAQVRPEGLVPRLLEPLGRQRMLLRFFMEKMLPSPSATLNEIAGAAARFDPRLAAALVSTHGFHAPGDPRMDAFWFTQMAKVVAMQDALRGALEAAHAAAGARAGGEMSPVSLRRLAFDVVVPAVCFRAHMAKAMHRVEPMLRFAALTVMHAALCTLRALLRIVDDAQAAELRRHVLAALPDVKSVISCLTAYGGTVRDRERRGVNRPGRGREDAYSVADGERTQYGGEWHHQEGERHHEGGDRNHREGDRRHREGEQNPQNDAPANGNETGMARPDAPTKPEAQDPVSKPPPPTESKPDDPIEDMAIRCMELFSATLPSAIEESNFDLDRLLPTRFWEVHALTPARQRALLALLASSLDAALGPPSLAALTPGPGAGRRRFATTYALGPVNFSLRLLTGAGCETKGAAARALALRQLLAAGLFDVNPLEADLWAGLLAALPRVPGPDSLQERLCNSLGGNLKSVVRQSETLLRTRLVEAPSGDGWAVPSGLSMLAVHMVLAAHWQEISDQPPEASKAIVDFCVLGLALAAALAPPADAAATARALARSVTRVYELDTAPAISKRLGKLYAVIRRAAAGEIAGPDFSRALLDEVLGWGATKLLARLETCPAALLVLAPRDIAPAAAARAAAGVERALIAAHGAGAPLSEVARRATLQAALRLARCAGGPLGAEPWAQLVVAALASAVRPRDGHVSLAPEAVRELYTDEERHLGAGLAWPLTVGAAVLRALEADGDLASSPDSPAAELIRCALRGVVERGRDGLVDAGAANVVAELLAFVAEDSELAAAVARLLRAHTSQVTSGAVQRLLTCRVARDAAGEEVSRALGQLAWRWLRSPPSARAMSFDLNGAAPAEDRAARAAACLGLAAELPGPTDKAKAWRRALESCLAADEDGAPEDDARVALSAAAAQAVVAAAAGHKAFWELLPVLCAKLGEAKTAAGLAALLAPCLHALQAGADLDSPDNQEALAELAQAVADALTGRPGLKLLREVRRRSGGRDVSWAAVPLLTLALRRCTRSRPEAMTKFARSVLADEQKDAAAARSLLPLEVACVLCSAPGVTPATLEPVLGLFRLRLERLRARGAPGVFVPAEAPILLLMDTFPSEAVASLPQRARRDEDFAGVVEEVLKIASAVLEHRLGHVLSMLVARRLVAGLLPGEDDDEEAEGAGAEAVKRARHEATSSGEALVRAPHAPRILLATRQLLDQALSLEQLLAIMQLSAAAPLFAGAAGLSRPISSIVQLAEVPQAELEPSLHSPSPAHIKKELCELMESLLDIMALFDPGCLAQGTAGKGPRAGHGDRGTALQGKLRRLLPLLMAGYGGTLSPGDRAVWSLARTINGHLVAGGDAGDREPSVSLQALLAGPLAEDTGLTFGVASVGPILEAGGWSALTQEQYDRVQELDPLRFALTAAHFPDWRRLLDETRPERPGSEDSITGVGEERAASRLLRRGPAAGAGAVGARAAPADLPYAEAGYDPSHALCASLLALRAGRLRAARAAGGGLLALALRSLAAPDPALRAAAYEVVALVDAALTRDAAFAAVEQVRVALAALRRAVTAPLQRLAATHALFLAEGVAVAFVPTAPLYGRLCSELLHRPALDLGSVPLARHALLSGLPGIGPVRLFVLRLVLCTLRSSRETRLLLRRGVLWRLLDLAEADGLEPAERRTAAKAVCRAAAVPSAAARLVLRGTALAWLPDRIARDASSGIVPLIEPHELRAAVENLIAHAALARPRRSGARAPLADLLVFLVGTRRRLLLARDADVGGTLAWLRSMEARIRQALAAHRGDE